MINNTDYIKKITPIKEEAKLMNTISEFRVICKCGHTCHPINKFVICSHCGRKVLPKSEQIVIFKDKLLQEINKLESEE